MPTKWEKKRDELEAIDPFSDDEKAAYQERDRNFIRSIQMAKGKTKKQAIKDFNKYLNSEGRTRKNFRRKIQNKNREDNSPPTHVKPIDITKHRYISKSGKLQKTPKEYAAKTKSPKVKHRIISAEKKYPDASTYELRHGVNSKASQEYRLRHGQGRYYEGRINKT